MSTDHDKVFQARTMFGIALGRYKAAQERLDRANAELSAAGSEFQAADKDLAAASNGLIELRWWEHVDDLKSLNVDWSKGFNRQPEK